MFLHPYRNRIPALLPSILQSCVRIYGAIPHRTDMHAVKNVDLYMGRTRFEFRPVRGYLDWGFRGFLQPGKRRGITSIRL